jgi:hypothetical protein
MICNKKELFRISYRFSVVVVVIRLNLIYVDDVCNKKELFRISYRFSVVVVVIRLNLIHVDDGMM